MIEVKVPATSANLGPGFDCMGLAVSAYAYFRFTEIEAGLVITGCNPMWQNENNLVVQGFAQVAQALGKKVPSLQIDIDAQEIPEARGLGSSAVCIVAGALAANEYYGSPLRKDDLLDLCTKMEGHPDNVAPAIYGGLTVSFLKGEHAYTVRYDVDPQLHFCAMIPDYSILTKEAREVLPKTLTYADAIFNIGRCAALASGLSSGNLEIIANACDDKLHQPYRKALFPEYEEIDERCKQLGILTWYISGSGSTMMAITEDEAKGKQLLMAVKAAHPQWQVKQLFVDASGACVRRITHG